MTPPEAPIKEPMTQASFDHILGIWKRRCAEAEKKVKKLEEDITWMADKIQRLETELKSTKQKS